MSRSLLAANTDTQTTSNATTINLSALRQTPMVFPIFTANLLSNSHRLLCTTRTRHNMVTQVLVLINPSLMLAIKHHIAMLDHLLSQCRVWYLVNLSHSRYSYQTTWLVPSLAKVALRSTKFGSLVAV